MLLVLHDLPFMVSHIFGPNSQVASDHGIYHGLSTYGDLLPGGRKVLCRGGHVALDNATHIAVRIVTYDHNSAPFIVMRRLLVLAWSSRKTRRSDLALR